jgi:ubiquinone/menaquinone biosynthesis C-methylase UbiE
MEREQISSRWSKAPDAPAIFRAVMGTAPTEDYAAIAESWDFENYKLVADLGGGGGALIAAVLKTYPHLSGMLVDHQASIDSARPRIVAEGLEERCQLIAADLLEQVPAGADVYLLKHVLHGYEDSRSIQLLKNCRAAMHAEGRLLIIEFVIPDVIDSPDPQLEKRLMSDLNMMAVTGGKERSQMEWRDLLDESSLDLQAIIPVAADLVSIIEAALRT